MNELSKFLLLENLSQYGIVDVGLTTSAIPYTLSHYNEWVENKKHGPLTYLEGERQNKRQDLRHYFEEFQSSLVFLFSYAESKKALDAFYESDDSNGKKIAGYVLGFGGVDYHFEVKARLEEIRNKLQELDPELKIELSLDIQPVLERDLALRAGIGWFGKNSMLINKEHGSFVIIGSLLLNKNLSHIVSEKKMETDHCGQCTRCIDACPTNAIEIDSRVLIANKCISTFTIELFKEAAAPEGMDKAQGEIFGCDICQDVCPWNKRWLRERLKLGALARFDWSGLESLKEIFLTGTFSQVVKRLEAIGVREFKRLFKGTPLERTGRNGLLKNLLHKKGMQR